MLPVVGLIAVGFTVAWLVGREWADRTIGALFALPVSRATLASAKLLVAAVWAVGSISLGVVLVAAGLAVVAPDTLTADVAAQLARAWATGIAMAALTAPFGWVAARTRGVLGAAGAIIGVTAASQLLATIGAGAWVPYVSPAIWAGAAGADAVRLVGPWSLVTLMLTVAWGGWATVRAMERAVVD